jgi:hemerythrin-like domain-containing protein
MQISEEKPLNILCALLGEHGALLHQLEVLRLTAPKYSEEKLGAATFALAEAIENHAGLEDELLFEALVASGRMPTGPVEAMRSEHRAIESLLGQILAPAGEAGRPDPQRTVLRLVETVRHHFGHEEHALFPMASQILTSAQLEELGSRWAQRRGVEIGALLAK